MLHIWEVQSSVVIPKIVFSNDKMRIGWGGMDWIDLTQDRDQWRALVNMVWNLQVP
jgi:hypothetical protein